MTSVPEWITPLFPSTVNFRIMKARWSVQPQVLCMETPLCGDTSLAQSPTIHSKSFRCCTWGRNRVDFAVLLNQPAAVAFHQDQV